MSMIAETHAIFFSAVTSAAVGSLDSLSYLR
jgi:hypothetical protein